MDFGSRLGLPVDWCVLPAVSCPLSCVSNFFFCLSPFCLQDPWGLPCCCHKTEMSLLSLHALAQGWLLSAASCAGLLLRDALVRPQQTHNAAAAATVAVPAAVAVAAAAAGDDDEMLACWGLVVCLRRGY